MELFLELEEAVPAACGVVLRAVGAGPEALGTVPVVRGTVPEAGRADTEAC